MSIPALILPEDFDPDDLLTQLDAEECERDLATFIRRAWNVVDPSRYTHSWHLDCLSDHLMAVTDGQIRRLLINLPPRMTKSLTVSTFWPAWTWALRRNPEFPLQGAQVKFLCLSYASSLAMDSARHHYRLITSPWYQKRWGDRVQIDPDQDRMDEFGTTAHGIRYSVGMGGSVLGRGGDIRICFPAEEVIWTERGPLPIGDLVRQRLQVRVWSRNAEGRPELQPVTAWHTNPSSRLVRLVFDDGSFVRATPCHRFLKASGDWQAAGEIPLGTLIRAGRALDVAGDTGPCQPRLDGPYGRLGNAVPDSKDRIAVGAGGDQARNLAGDFGAWTILKDRKRAVALRIVDVLCARAVFQIRQAGIVARSVLVPDFLSLRTWAYESAGDKAMNHAVGGFTVAPETNARIALVEGCLQDGFRLPELAHRSVAARDFDLAPTRTHTSEVGHEIVGEADNGAPLFKRVVGVFDDGFAHETFCVSVAQNGNMYIGLNAIVLGSNCDDVHKPDEVESDLVRGAVIRQYAEELALRVTDPKTSAEVIIMQRLATNDLSGYVLDAGGDDLVHVCLPNEYDPQRHCVTVLGWQDPRGCDEEGKELPGRSPEGNVIPGSPLAKAEGALLWPERLPREEVEKLKTRLGPFSYAGRMQQAPVPRGGGVFKSEWWRLWQSETYPEFSTVLVSLDTASTEKEENDESGLTAWGAWADGNGRPQIMLIDAWEGRLEFDPLVRRTMEMCRAPNGNPTCPADILLVEAKNIGHPVMTEVRRLMATRDIAIQGFNPIGDKYTRAIAIQHMFSGTQTVDPETGMKSWTGGCIWAPDKDWAQLVIDRCANFRAGQRKNLALIDTTSQAIKYLRDSGVILRTEEYEEERTEERRYKKPRGPRYDV